MKKRFKIVLNVEVEEPEKPFPAGGNYTHFNRIQGIAHLIGTACSWLGPLVRVSVDKIIDKGPIESV